MALLTYSIGICLAADLGRQLHGAPAQVGGRGLSARLVGGQEPWQPGGRCGAVV